MKIFAASVREPAQPCVVLPLDCRAAFHFNAPNLRTNCQHQIDFDLILVTVVVDRNVGASMSNLSIYLLNDKCLKQMSRKNPVLLRTVNRHPCQRRCQTEYYRDHEIVRDMCFRHNCGGLIEAITPDQSSKAMRFVLTLLLNCLARCCQRIERNLLMGIASLTRNHR